VLKVLSPNLGRFATDCSLSPSEGPLPPIKAGGTPPRFSSSALRSRISSWYLHTDLVRRCGIGHT